MPAVKAEAAPAQERGSIFVRSAGWLRAHIFRFARWFVLLFIASLMLPALTKQWSDRKQELQIKESLSTDISKVSANAVYGAVSVVEEEEAQQRPSRHAVLHTWLRERASIDPRFFVYFSNSDAADDWFAGRRKALLGFRNAVLIYILMACCDDPHSQSHRAARLHSYLGNAPVPPKPNDPWRVLACAPQEDGCTVSGGYPDAYRWLGNRLLDQRHVLLDQLLHANAAGFSSGWHDFINDLNPLG